VKEESEKRYSRRSRLSKRVIWKAALLALGICVVGHAIHGWRHCPMTSVDAKSIRCIDVWLCKHSEGTIGYSVNDQATIVQILDAMKPFSRDWHPALWQKYGFLNIEFTNGTKVGVEVYDVGEEVGAFSIDRVYYRGGSETKLKDILNSEGKRESKRGRSLNCQVGEVCDRFPRCRDRCQDEHE
jgi:hypothetical protein